MTELDRLLQGRYRVEIHPEQDGGFVAMHPELEGCIAQGETLEETLAELEESRELWIETRYEDGLPIPVPTESLPSGRLTLRLPRFLHGELAKQAELQEVSLNQHVVMLLSRSSLEASVSTELSAQIQALVASQVGGSPNLDLMNGSRGEDCESLQRISARSSAWELSPALREAACFLFAQGEEGRELAADLLAELPEDRMSTFMLGLLYFMAEEPSPGSPPEAVRVWEDDLSTGWDHVIRSFRNNLSFQQASKVALSIPGLKLDVLWERLMYLVTLFADESKNSEVAEVISWVAWDRGESEKSRRYKMIAAA